MKLSCDDDINEAVQETIIQAFKYIKRLRKPESFKSWIIKILVNNCNKIYKKMKKKNSMEYAIEYNSQYNNTQPIYSEENSINNLDFFILIKNLKYKERICLTLYYLENLPIKEISKILKEPESTIRNRISRAIMKLKKIYRGDDDNE